MLQHSDDLFEPDSSAHIAIQLQWPTAATTAHHQGGHLFNGEVRRQLALYHREMVSNSRNRKNSIAVKGKLDPGGVQQKQAKGRLPKDLSLVTRMRGQLWTQVWAPVWDKVQDWLLLQGFEATEQSYLSTTHLDTLGPYLRQQGLTDTDCNNLRTLLILELCFQRSQVWLNALCKEFRIEEHEGRMLYRFQLTRSFKRASTTSRGSMPASTQWPLSELQSVLVHTLLHAGTRAERMLPKLTQQSMAKVIKGLGWNWCGVPRLGPHVLRTQYTSEAVNRPDITPAEYPALAAHLQFSLDTLAVYAAPSLNGPVAQVGFKLHNGSANASATEQQQPEPPKKKQRVEAELAREEAGSNQQMLTQLQQMMQQQREQQREHHEQQMQAMQSLNDKPTGSDKNKTGEAEPVLVPVKSDAPNGRALNTLRLRHMPSIKSYFMYLDRAVCTEEQAPATQFVKRVFHQLCDLRAANSLGAGNEWFAVDVTHFTDENELPFANFIRKYWNKS